MSEPSQSLLPTFKAAGIKPRLLIDQFLMRFESPKPVPARTAHTVLRKTLGDQALYCYLCHPESEEERQKASYRSFSVALHDLIPDRKHGMPGISMAQLRALCADLSPQAPVITYNEITLDCYESTPLSDAERAEIALAFILRCANAVGMPKIKGARNKDERPITFKSSDVEGMKRHLMLGYSLFTKDSQGRELKGYIKTHDTVRAFNPDTGKNETSFKLLPVGLHRLRIEWTFEGDACPLKTLKDLDNLKPLASLFYANLLGVCSAKLTAVTLKPARSGHRRKKPKDACADTCFNRWIRGSARCFQLQKSNTEKGAVKINLKTRSTEGKTGFQPAATLITSEAALPPLPGSFRRSHPEGIPIGHEAVSRLPPPSHATSPQAQTGTGSSLHQLASSLPRSTTGQHGQPSNLKVNASKAQEKDLVSKTVQNRC